MDAEEAPVKLVHKYLTGARAQLVDLERQAYERHDPELLDFVGLIGAGLVIVEVALDRAADRAKLLDEELV